MKVINAQEGESELACPYPGRAAHSAYPVEGVNAVEIAADLICHIRNVYKTVHEHGLIDDGYAPSIVRRGCRTMLRAGGPLNIVPDACEFRFELRHLPEKQPTVISANRILCGS